MLPVWPHLSYQKNKFCKKDQNFAHFALFCLKMPQLSRAFWLPSVCITFRSSSVCLSGNGMAYQWERGNHNESGNLVCHCRNQSKSFPRPWPEYETHYTIGTCQWVTPTDHPKYSRSHWISNSGFAASNEKDTIIRTGKFSCTTNTEKNYLDLRWFLCHADNFLLTQITGTPSSSFGNRNIIRVPYLGVKNSKLKDTSKFLSLCPCLHL